MPSDRTEICLMRPLLRIAKKLTYYVKEFRNMLTIFIIFFNKNTLWQHPNYPSQFKS